jgi:hypothetical protein
LQASSQAYVRSGRRAGARTRHSRHQRPHRGEQRRERAVHAQHKRTHADSRASTSVEVQHEAGFFGVPAHTPTPGLRERNGETVGRSTKTCRHCGEAKDASAFRRHPRIRDALSSWCTDRHNAATWRWRVRQRQLVEVRLRRVAANRCGDCASRQAARPERVRVWRQGRERIRRNCEQETGARRIRRRHGSATRGRTAGLARVAGHAESR